MFQYHDAYTHEITHWGSVEKKICLEKSIIAQKMKFSIKDFFSKCDQIRSFLRFGHI